MLTLHTRLHPVSRRAFISNGSSYLLYSDQAPSMLSLQPEERKLVEALFPGATFLEWVGAAADTLDLATDEALRRVHRLANALTEAGHIGIDEPPVPFDWIPRVAPPADKGTRTAYLSLTDACNLDCVYCYNQAERARKAAHEAAPLSDGEIRGLIDRLAAYGFEYLVFTGGEPMLRKSIFALAEHARGRGLGVNLLTNGTAFTPRNVGQVAALFDSVTVSLDSSTPAAHDTLRGAGSWGRIVLGLDRLVAAGARQVALRPVITALNAGSLHDLPGFAYRRWGITRFEPCLYLPVSIEQIDGLGLLPDVGTYGAATERFALALRDIPDAVAEDPIRAVSFGGKCGMADSILSVGASGDVYPCQALHYAPLCMGNVRNASIADLFEAGRALGIVGSSGLDTPECRDCPFLMLCGGGCRANLYQLYGNMTAHNRIMCPYLRAGAEGQLRRYANHLLAQRAAEAGADDTHPASAQPVVPAPHRA